jgi:hypothetical protein
MAKIVEFTGSPKSSGFKTKASFLAALEPFGYCQSKMTKKGNKVDILVTDDMSSMTNKMQLANELGVEIMTYTDLVEAFDLEGDL